MVYILDFKDLTHWVHIFILMPGGQAYGLITLDNWDTMYVVFFQIILYYFFHIPGSRMKSRRPHKHRTLLLKFLI